MIERLKCPVCAWEHRLMPVAMQSVTWGACACTDRHCCVYHTMHLGAAKRPSDEEMEKRRLEQEAYQRQKFEALRQRMEAADKFRVEIDKIRAALEKEQQVTQHLTDSAVHYRNLAIVLGAKPEQMMGEFDRKLCEDGINPDETSGGYHVSVNQQLGELKETWGENDKLRAALRALLEEAEDKCALRDETVEMVNAALGNRP